MTPSGGAGTARARRRRPLLAGALIIGTTTGIALSSPAGAIDGFPGPLFSLETSADGESLVVAGGDGLYTVDDPAGAADLSGPWGPAGIQGLSETTDSGGRWAVSGGVAAQSDTGQAIYFVDAAGDAELVANLFAAEASLNPDGKMPFDSNPVAVEALGDGAAIVADAGANAVLHVDRDGTVTVLAVLPDEPVSSADIKALAGCPGSAAPFCAFPDPMPAQGTPTSLSIGDDGSIYVGELKGMPAPTGESNIWRIAPGASGAACGSSPDCTKVFDGGFTSIMDLELGPDGRLYVAELDEATWAAVEITMNPIGGTVDACDLVSKQCEEVATDLATVTDIAFTADGSLWAIENALNPDAAEVVRIVGGEDPGEPGGGSVELTVEVPELPDETGDLRIAVSATEVDLGQLQLDSDPAFLSAAGLLAGVTVVDERIADPGWSVSGQVSDLTVDGAGATIDADLLGWAPAVASVSPGQVVTAGAPALPGAGLGSTRGLASAAPGDGVGTAVLGAVLALVVPTTVDAGVYTGVLTLTVI